MAYEAERKLLRERDAVRVSYRANRQDQTIELVRQWQTSKEDLQSSALTFLNTYGSVSNYDSEAPVAHLYVTDPLADQVAYPGRWRVVLNDAVRKKTNPEEQGIYQTLRLGWIKSAENLPTPVLLEDAKTLLSPFAHDITSQKRRYIYEYRYIDPSYAVALRDTIALAAGVIDARVVKQEEGYCNIHVLTETNTWAGDLTQRWTRETLNPTFDAEAIVDNYKHIPLASLQTYRTTLSTPTAGYKVASLVDTTEDPGFGTLTQRQEKLFSGDVTAANGKLQAEEYLLLLTDGVIRSTMWLGVPDAQLAAAMAAVAVAPAGYTVLKVANNFNGIGSFTLTRDMINEVTPASHAMAAQWPTFDDERRSYYYFGLNRTQADAQYITLQTTCDAGYKVDSVQIQEWKWNTLVVVQQISKLNLKTGDPAAYTKHIRGYDYTPVFGLVERGTTILLNIAKASISDAKSDILADTDIIVLNIQDDDVGQGKANITYTWRSKPVAARSMGATRQERISQFHQITEERQWIDVSITDIDSVKTQVAAAMAAIATPDAWSAATTYVINDKVLYDSKSWQSLQNDNLNHTPEEGVWWTEIDKTYEIAAGETVRGASAEDMGDKTARVTQRVTKESETAYADYENMEVLNPHGFEMANMIISVREYPEVNYANIGTTFTALQAFIGAEANGKWKGRIQVRMNAIRLNGTFGMRGLKEGTPDWTNTPTAPATEPTYVKTGASNVGLIGESRVDTATGVPVASAAALAAAATAAADHNLDSATMTERGQGEAALEKRQTKKSETAVQVREEAGLGMRRAEKRYTWPFVLAANIGTVWTAALTEGVAGDYVLVFRQKDILGNGMYRVSNLVVECTEKTTSWTSMDSNGVAIVSTAKQDAATLPDAAHSSGIVQSVEGGLNQFNKYDYVLRATTASKLDTGWVEYNDVFGTSSIRVIEHGSTADRDAVIADFVAGRQNSLSVSEEPFGLLTIRASQRLSGVNRNTFFGQLDSSYKTWTTTQRERRADSTDVGGYKWRDVTITRRRYTGSVYAGGAALPGAWYNIQETPVPDADSVEPRTIGRYGGVAIYYSLRIVRTYPAEWQPSSTDVKA